MTKLKSRAKHYLKVVGYTDKEVSLIEESDYEYYNENRKRIAEDLAIKSLGRESWLSGIARARFHRSSARTCMYGNKIIYIERAI